MVMTIDSKHVRITSRLPPEYADTLQPQVHNSRVFTTVCQIPLQIFHHYSSIRNATDDHLLPVKNSYIVSRIPPNTMPLPSVTTLIDRKRSHLAVVPHSISSACIVLINTE